MADTTVTPSALDNAKAAYDRAMQDYEKAPKPMPKHPELPPLVLDKFDISKVSVRKGVYTLTGTMDQIMEGGGPHTYEVSVKVSQIYCNRAAGPTVIGMTCAPTNIELKLDGRKYTPNLSDLANLDKAIDNRLIYDMEGAPAYQTQSKEEKELKAELSLLPMVVEKVSNQVSYESKLAEQAKQ